MATAFAGARYELVYDQVCYSPLDALIGAEVFAGKVGRYVMASTIEVYRPLLGRLERPFREDDLALAGEPIELDYPWHAPAAAQRYGDGKRQAEALLYRDGRLPVTSVRIGHVLAGSGDFTGRLAGYADRLLRGQPLRHAAGSGPSSFIEAQGIADFLH
ncbi:hypothetical protein [Chitinimonas koreensis]|uniref:hypothetical protein n=1 Tax=Chitinimonas koreensis TaxID=356302 RepID=UPI0004029ABB|nr:hypothetical protein [Chitinimonas koreensis]QNM94853.1 hypothetical protein H9L41_13035 [Chitinimonas koreensis]